MRREIRTRRILVKPSFQDFDRINVLHVTYEQFTRALTKLGLNLPDICFKILGRKYMDKNNVREINYEQFLKDVDYEHLLNNGRNKYGPNTDDWEGKDGRGPSDSNLLPGPSGQYNALQGGQNIGPDGKPVKFGTTGITVPFGTDLMANGDQALPGAGGLNLSGGNKGGLTQSKLRSNKDQHTVGAPANIKVNLDEQGAKQQFDEDALAFSRADQKGHRPAGLESTENRGKNPINYTALGNSQLRVKSKINQQDSIDNRHSRRTTESLRRDVQDQNRSVLHRLR